MQLVTRLLADPFLMNKILVGVYAINSLQFIFRGHGWQALYWLGAGIITLAVTNLPKN